MCIHPASAIAATLVLTKNLAGVMLIGLGLPLGALDATREAAARRTAVCWGSLPKPKLLSSNLLSAVSNGR